MKPKELATRLFDFHSRHSGSAAGESAKYRRQLDCAEQQRAVTGDTDAPRAEKDRREWGCREVNLSFLPERYEPLVEEEEAEEVRDKEERKSRKKEKYKKVKKNVGTALRATWKCLLLGLHHFALVYSAPITAATNLAPEFHPWRARG